MLGGTVFFRIVEGDTGKGHTISEDKATFITKYSHTSYMDVMMMSYEMIDSFYSSLIDLIKLENSEREKKMSK